MLENRPLPPGDYAIVELFGHTTIVGRIAEVERFGAKFLAIEPLFNDAFLSVVLHGGSSIYRLTPCAAEIAFARQARDSWQLPTPIRAIIPPELLPAPDVDPVEFESEDAEFEQPYVEPAPEPEDKLMPNDRGEQFDADESRWKCDLRRHHHNQFRTF